MSARLPILATVGVPFEAEPLSAEHQRELDIIRERELGNLREELAALCTHMEYLRSWFDFYEKDICAMNDRAGANAHSHFVDGVIFARGIARAANFDVDRDRIQAHDWASSSTVPPAPEVGPAPLFEYLGGTLGMGDSEPYIKVRGPNGVGTLELQQCLYQVDDFAEPGRTRLLFAAGLHFGVTMNRGEL